MTRTLFTPFTLCSLEAHTKLTLEKKILLPFLPGFELATFRSRVRRSTNYLSRLLFGVRSTPVSPQWHVKDPGHSAKIAGGRLHLNTHTPLTQQSQSGLTLPLSGHSTGTYLEARAHTQVFREQSVTVVSARWANINWSWSKERN